MRSQKVDKKRLAEMKKIETLFATSRNYKNYRETLLNTTPPLVPHIGTILSFNALSLANN